MQGSASLVTRPHALAMRKVGLSELATHRLNLQLYGVRYEEARPYVDRTGNVMDFEARLRFPVPQGSTEPVTLKVPASRQRNSPYEIQSGCLHFQGQPLEVSAERICLVPLPPSESSWHLKGYTLPFRGTGNPFRELRINPRITGYCPGHCSFCHRAHSYNSKPDRRVIAAPADIIAKSLSMEEPGFLAQVKRVMFISELYGREDRFLDTVEATLVALESTGFSHRQEFNCSAQDVRTASGVTRLLAMVRPARYSSTLEMFTRREELMGKYKGIPLERLSQVLEMAREAGFVEIQLNYLAGFDSLDAAAEGFELLRERGLIDSVGLSTYTAWNSKQTALRHSDAWTPHYYTALALILRNLGIVSYHQDSYDMGCPAHELMDESRLEVV